MPATAAAAEAEALRPRPQVVNAPRLAALRRRFCRPADPDCPRLHSAETFSLGDRGLQKLRLRSTMASSGCDVFGRATDRQSADNLVTETTKRLWLGAVD